MAITSVAGATLTKLQSGGAGFPVPVSFTSQSYFAWIKIPSLGSERILFDHDGRIQIKIDASGRIALWLDGLLAATGTTVFSTNKWIAWAYKKTSANLHTVKICELNCINNLPVLGTQTTEIAITQILAAGNPTQFTFYIPAGCDVCMMIMGSSTFGPFSAHTSWHVGSDSSYIWKCPARFPNDLYDHREVSASQGDRSFHGMHEWESQTGTIILAPGGDPEHLLDKICSAIVAKRSYSPPKEIAHAPLAPLEVGETYIDFGYTILTDVLPVSAVLNSIKVGAYATLIPGGGGGIIFPDTPGKWKFGIDPTEYGPFPFAGDSYEFYDWSHFGVPNPQVNNPSTGLPWTLNDLYNATVLNGAKWIAGGAGGICSTHTTFDSGIAVLYFGQTTPGTCGGGPPPVNTGTIVVIKQTNIDDGTPFQFNAVNLTPNAFSLINNGSIQYNDVPSGSGYQIVEIVPAGWTVSYSISNGSPNTNIVVGVGETVVVTVTDTKLPNNMSGIYKIVPGKRQDTLWLEGFTGTRDVKIP